MAAKTLHLEEHFQNVTNQYRSLFRMRPRISPVFLFLLWKAGFWAMSFFPGGDPLSFHQQGVGASWLKQKLKEKAVRKLGRVAAREQMLLPHKLVEDYARPAVPSQCPVFTPRHDPLCLSYGPASGQFRPQLPYIYSNQALAGDLFMYTIQSRS